MKRFVLAALFVSIWQLSLYAQMNVTTTTGLTRGQHLVATATSNIETSGPIYDTRQSGSGMGIVSNIQFCLMALGSGGGICDARAESGQTTSSSLNVTNSGVTILMPPVTITIGAGLNFTISGSNSGFLCGGPLLSCTINEYAAGAPTIAAVNLIGPSGDFFIGFQTNGGRCDKTAVCHASGAGGMPNTENAITATGNGHQILNNLIADSGQIGVNLASCNSCLVQDNEIDRSGWEAILVNTNVNTQTANQNQILNNLVQNSQATNAQAQGQIGVSCSFLNCVGSTDGTLIEGNTVKNTPSVSGTFCTMVLNTQVSGCMESIQSTDNAYHTTISGNHVFNSYLEGIVCGGIGCVVTGNTCDACGIHQGGGLMWSYGLNNTITVGDAIFANNVITNSSTALIAYCGSIQTANANNSPTVVTYENIKFANNVCSGGNIGGVTSGGFINGFRFANVNTGNESVILKGIDFIGNTATDNVANGISLTYGATTTGVVLLENDVPMPKPGIAGFGTSPSIANNNGPYSFTVNVGTGGTATTGTIGFYAAPNGWTVMCSDFTTPTIGAREFSTTTTTAVIKGYGSGGGVMAWASGDLLVCQASPY
jgi:hypothetical protein